MECKTCLNAKVLIKSDIESEFSKFSVFLLYTSPLSSIIIYCSKHRDTVFLVLTGTYRLLLSQWDTEYVGIELQEDEKKPKQTKPNKTSINFLWNLKWLSEIKNKHNSNSTQQSWSFTNNNTKRLTWKMGLKNQMSSKTLLQYLFQVTCP